MIEPNTYCHAFTLDEPNKEAALDVAVAGYVARWKVRPTWGFINPSTAPIKTSSVHLIEDARIPVGHVWLQVEEVVMKQN